MPASLFTSSILLARRAAARLGTVWLLLVAVSPARALTFKTTYDQSLFTNLTASDITKAESAFTYAEAQFQSRFSDAITISITMAAEAGKNTLGGSSTSFIDTSYAEVKGALSGHRTTSNDNTSVANLPATAPAGTGGWSLPTAEAKALGFSGISPNDPTSDGTFTFGAGFAYTYDPLNRKVQGRYDFIGIAMHEISEIMGRNTKPGLQRARAIRPLPVHGARRAQHRPERHRGVLFHRRRQDQPQHLQLRSEW